MSVRGWVQGCVWRRHGSELTAPAAVGDITITVEDPTDYNDIGTIELNGVRMDYAEIDDDTGVITLTSTLGAAAEVGDRAFVVGGGQVKRDVALDVTAGDGEPIEVIVPFEQRAMWPEGDYDDPIEVVLSNDLEKIEEVPGRTPTVDLVLSAGPIRTAAKGANDAIPHNTWTKLGGWFTLLNDRVDLVNNDTFVIRERGLYDCRCGVTFVNNSVNNRAVRVRVVDAAGNEKIYRQVRGPADGQTSQETAQYIQLSEGDTVMFDVWQNSGAALDVMGSNVFTEPTRTDCAVVWVRPL